MFRQADQQAGGEMAPSSHLVTVQPAHIGTDHYWRTDSDERFRRRLSGAKNLQGHMIANCGEFLPIEAPAEFVKALVEFAPR